MTTEPGRRLAATATVQVDDARVRVTEWRFAPGAATGWHRHEYDYVVVPVTCGPLVIRDAEGLETRVDLVAGRAYARSRGVEHDVQNGGDGEVVFVEVEIK